VESATQTKAETGLRHELSAGQMAMVAVGSAVGTGLLLGSGAAIQIAGPVISISYILGVLIAFAVTMALGELACRHAGAGSFGVYADLYLNHWAGFVSRYGFWVGIMISVSAELIAAATYLRFWFPKVPALLWIILYTAALIFINLREVVNFASFEYWFAMIKVVVIVVFIILGAALLLGGRVVPHYVSDGGLLPHGIGGPLLAISFALFSFLGIELVAVSSGESKSVAAIRNATYATFGLLAFVYLGAITVLAGVLPWREAGVGQSPFVMIFAIAHVPAATHITNFVVLTAALSASNASLYCISRMLYSLAVSGYAPKGLTKLDRRGVPRRAILVSTLGIVSAMAGQLYAPADAYLYMIGASLFGGMLAWGIALLSHINMRRRLSSEELAALPMRAPGGAVASALAFLGLAAVIVSTWWVPQTRITILSGGPYLLILSVFYLVMKKFATYKQLH
jgi:L-asparagine transporter-like permease